MYGELIKNLRICATEANCKNCGLNDDGDCQEKLMKQAADAIEELLASCDNFEAALKDSVEECEKLQQYADLYKDLTEKSQKVATELKQQLQKSEEDNVNLTGWLAEEHAKHLWIPVTERLPEHSGFYIIFQVGGSYGQLSEIKIAYWDRHNFNGGMMTTHWMPIPEPPKEKT